MNFIFKITSSCQTWINVFKIDISNLKYFKVVFTLFHKKPKEMFLRIFLGQNVPTVAPVIFLPQHVIRESVSPTGPAKIWKTLLKSSETV